MNTTGIIAIILGLFIMVREWVLRSKEKKLLKEILEYSERDVNNAKKDVNDARNAYDDALDAYSRERPKTDK